MPATKAEHGRDLRATAAGDRRPVGDRRRARWRRADGRPGARPALLARGYPNSEPEAGVNIGAPLSCQSTPWPSWGVHLRW